MKRLPNGELDLHDDGPLRRADGQVAYNGHFWPMGGDDYWGRHHSRELDYGISWSENRHLCVVELNNGKWLMGPYPGSGLRSEQFETREAAFRAGAKVILDRARSSFLNQSPHQPILTRMSSREYGFIVKFVNWVLKTEEANGWARKAEPEGEA
jgi:hypothetical protein